MLPNASSRGVDKENGMVPGAVPSCLMAGLKMEPPGEDAPVLPLHRELAAQFTGNWPAGFQPRWRRTPWWHLASTLGGLGLGVAGGSLVCLGPPAYWPLCAVAWMFTVQAARKSQLVLCHYAVHSTLTGCKWGDRLVAEGLSTLFTFQGFDGYYRDHVRTHHSSALATLEDPDAQFLLRLGLRPGMRREALWRQLYWTLVAPRFHLLFLRSRWRANFVDAPRYRRVMAWLYTALLLTVLFVTGGWGLWLVVWGMPVFVLYHIAALLQFVCEHHWFADLGIKDEEDNR